MRTVIRIVTKFNLRGLWAMPHPSKKFRQNPFTTFSVIRRTDSQTDRSENITSFGGGKNTPNHRPEVVIPRLMFIVLSSRQSHCESSPGSRGECRTAPGGRRPLNQAISRRVLYVSALKVLFPVYFISP